MVYAVLKSKFLRIYANLPEPERHQVIAVINNQGYSWNVALNEIQNNTKLGKDILKKMEVLGIL